MSLLPASLRQHCENILSEAILDVQTVSGGDINQACRLISSSRSYFLKYNTASFAADMFQKEAQGLDLLRQASALHIPEFIATDVVENVAFLILEFIDLEATLPSFWENFAKALVQLHQIKASQFGLEQDNYIGRLPQSNRFKNTWIDFLIEERLDHQLQLGIDQQLIPKELIKSFHRLYAQLINILPEEAPSLLHGDLWSGNFMVGTNQQAVLIDPAAYFGHREMDLAMTMLFGGFAPSFYEAYQYHFPLEKGFEMRLDIYKLYYLLVHVNLFGPTYLNPIRQILHKHKFDR